MAKESEEESLHVRLPEGNNSALLVGVHNQMRTQHTSYHCSHATNGRDLVGLVCRYLDGRWNTCRGSSERTGGSLESSVTE